MLIMISRQGMTQEMKEAIREIVPLSNQRIGQGMTQEMKEGFVRLSH